MADHGHPYQPGVILHDSIMGAFRSTGRSMEDWCREHDVKRASARNASFGQSSGPLGKRLLAQMIEDAGPDLVRSLYLARLCKHLDDVRREPSRMAAEMASSRRAS